MKEKLLLVGAGGLGRVVLEHMGSAYDCAFLDDGGAAEVDGAPVIGKTGDMEKLYPEYRRLIVTIGNNALRQKLCERAKRAGYALENVIVPSAYVSPHAAVGRGTIILNNAVVQNNARIGDGCILNAGVETHQDSAVGDYCLIYTNSVVRSLARVGDRVWIGSTATVSTGAAVPDDTEVPDGGVYESEG